jgi:Ca-activated chloride channel family protein
MIGHKRAAVQLNNHLTIPNKDFILEYKIQQGHEPTAALFSTRKDDADYFLLMAVPQLDVSPNTHIRKEMIFVIDVSGSMTGTSIVQARRGLIEALDRLSSDDRFNIIAFNDRFSFLSASAIPATEENVAAGQYFANSLSADGGTMAYPALQFALTGSPGQSMMRMIIFLTEEWKDKT